MVEVVGIAALDAGERCVGERGFDLHGGGGILIGLGLRLAGEHQQMRHVGDEVLADFLALRVGFGVVVAVGQSEAAGVDADDHHAGILRILFSAGVEEVEAALIGALAQEGGDLFAILDGGDAVELRLERREAARVDGIGVHAGGVVVADLLLRGRAVSEPSHLLRECPRGTGDCHCSSFA